ncbi:hypothetical protein CASFOL_015941 [Castilleja foliolosa]|uniref:WEB family protein n=1 Tax=Castilleja foliolosa TaxID=1961234 RepID=A0ABD3DFJ0_9LAMI
MDGGGVIRAAANKAEIDTSKPFRSVREAVMLFGERVLAGEVYANKLKEMQDKTNDHGHRVVASELEETKQSLQKAREESNHLAQFLSSLQQELEQTKTELQRLRTRPSDTRALDPESEDLKYVESSKEIADQAATDANTSSNNNNRDHQRVEFHKKKYVSFANHPPVVRVIAPSTTPCDGHVLERHSSLKKKKKKQLIPFIAGIFSKKSGSSNSTLA